MSVNKSQIIVIGAGISGLAAAKTLQDNGYQVTIIEGRNRIGGRMHTVKDWAELPIDLGARWIQGIKKNPIRKIADEINADYVETDFENAWLYDKNGEELEDDIWDHLEHLGKKLIKKAVKSQTQKGFDCSLEKALNDLEKSRELSITDQELFNFYVNSYLEHEYSADISEMSALNLDDAEGFKGAEVILPGGYNQITDYLAEGLDIRLKHCVQSIDYHEGVKVETNQGVFEAEKAIITLPLGILKKGEIKFSPSLPVEKTNAIESLGVGLLNPTYIKFSDVFWPNEAEILNYISEEKGRWTEWLNLHYYTGVPVLLGYNAGNYARELEQKTDEEVISDAMGVLRLLYGPGVPDPVDYRIARWGQDEFANGSYSFNAVGSSRKSRIELGKSVNNRLFFAGEATSEDYPATVPGAYLSGLREAEKIKGIDT